MITLVPLPRGRVCRRQGRIGLEALGHEVLGVLPRAGVVVHPPDVQDDGGVLREVHAFDLAVCETQRWVSSVKAGEGSCAELTNLLQARGAPRAD